MKENQKLAEIKLKEDLKKVLGTLGKPRRLAEIAAKTDLGYTTTHQKLSILEAKGFVNKIKTSSGKTLYSLKDIEL